MCLANEGFSANFVCFVCPRLWVCQRDSANIKWTLLKTMRKTNKTCQLRCCCRCFCYNCCRCYRCCSCCCSCCCCRSRCRLRMISVLKISCSKLTEKKEVQATEHTDDRQTARQSDRQTAWQTARRLIEMQMHRDGIKSCASCVGVF